MTLEKNTWSASIPPLAGMMVLCWGTPITPLFEEARRTIPRIGAFVQVQEFRTTAVHSVRRSDASQSIPCLFVVVTTG